MNPDRSARQGRPPVPPRDRSAARPADRLRPADSRPLPPRREPMRPNRPADRALGGSRPVADRPPSSRAAEARPAAARDRAVTRASTGGSDLRGIVAVLGIFLVTLAGAAIDSYTGIGLGMITLGALLGSTTVATLAVRRRDLVSVVVSPPLVFIAVAAVNIGLAPSATFSLPTVATLLIRGFPTMAMATGVALVLALFRLITRR